MHPSFTSGGRHPNWQKCCFDCEWMSPNLDGDGGWCTHPENRTKPSGGWPGGFCPSVASTGGCDLHTTEPLPSR